MNPKGHAKTLVASHPGNKNAVKTGLFSPELLASRIVEAERALTSRDPDELISDLLRSEIARFVVLRDAMDQTLEEDGLRGRRGEPRSMIDLRLRLNTRLLKTIDEFASRSPKDETAVAERPDSEQLEAASSDLLEEIGFRHQRESLDLIDPEEFDPALFLATIVESNDSTVSIDDQIRARTLLTRWRAGRSALCACFSTRAARDGAEFRGWIDELREAGFTQADEDDGIAETVRALARGETLEPHAMYLQTSRALDAVIAAALKRVASGEETRGSTSSSKGSLNTRLWRTMLSADRGLSLQKRLKAFDALEKAGAFRRCTCGGPKPKHQLAEERYDAALAYIVRLAGGRHYRAATAAVEFPETYLAVRDAIDTGVRSRRETTD